MVVVTEAGQQALERVGSARQREREWLEDFDARKKVEREAGREVFQADLTTLIGVALIAGVPKRQIAQAYGTTTFTNIPVATAAMQYAREATDAALLAALGDAPTAPQADPSPAPSVPVKEENPEFDPEEVRFMERGRVTNMENDFGVPLVVEQWDVYDPSGLVVGAEVYYPAPGHEADAEWGVNLHLIEGLDIAEEMSIVGSTVRDIETYRNGWGEQQNV